MNGRNQSVKMSCLLLLFSISICGYQVEMKAEEPVGTSKGVWGTVSKAYLSTTQEIVVNALTDTTTKIREDILNTVKTADAKNLWKENLDLSFTSEELAKATVERMEPLLGSQIVLNVAVGDYNGDGSYEGFVRTVEESEAFDYEHVGCLYYVTEDNIEKIDFPDYPMSAGYVLTAGEYSYYSMEPFGAMTSVALIYGVDDRNHYYLSGLSDHGCLIGNEDGINTDFRLYHETFDAVKNPEPNDGRSGRTAKFYWIMIDHGTLYEAGGIEISSEQFMLCDEGSEILKQVAEEGYEIYNILYRTNGIINVNLQRQDGEFIGYHHRTYCLEEGTSHLTEVQTNFHEGTYLPAVVPEEARYPSKFPLS